MTNAHNIKMITDMLGTHPMIGAFVFVGLSILNFFLPSMNANAAQIPLIYMQTIQILFWMLGGTVSAITIISWFRKIWKEYKEQEEERNV